jgi:hypothetical protein
MVIMFVFQEGDLFTRIQFDRDIRSENLVFQEPMTFKDAILTLASRLREPNTVFIFWNFFSKACANLESYEKRGLERMALGVNAIEFHKGERLTRFLVGVAVNELRIESIASMIQAMLTDKVSYGIGNFRQGNTLLVGDTPGNKAMGYNTPFVGSGSGLWLLKQLEAAGIPEDKYYWINAKDNFGIEADKQILTDLKPRKIIAMGNEAAKWADSLRNRYHVLGVPHPQFWLRFRSAQEYPLLKLLK